MSQDHDIEEKPQAKAWREFFEAVNSSDEPIPETFERVNFPREAERLRAKARHDEAQVVSNAEQRGRQAGIFDVAKNLLGLDVPIEKIVESTSLTREEVEGLLQ